MPTPFSGEIFTFKNPDGSEIQVRGWGNQFHAVFETLDGYTVVKNPDTGAFEYAQLSDDKNQLIPTGVAPGEADPDDLGIRPHIRIRREAAKDAAVQARASEGAPRRWEVRRAQKKA